MYGYVKAAAGDDPAFALLAHRVHAVSYLGEEFITEDAITETGEVTAALDKARGPGVEYYVGFADDGVAVSTLRKVHAQQRGGHELLPGYQVCADVIDAEAKEFLAAAEEAGRPIVEMSSFGHIPELTSAAGLEIMRHVMQEAQGTDEVWFFSMVTEKLQALQNRFGPLAIRSIGKAIAIKDERARDITLTPGCIDMRTFFDDIREAILVEPDRIKRKRYLQCLRFITQGVPLEQMSEAVGDMIQAEQSFDFTAYLQANTERALPVEWSRPQRLALESPADVAYAKRLVDDGATVTDPSLGEDSTKADATEGSWFYYPWNKSLVHFPDKEEHRKLIHQRDRHLVTQEEQDTLQDKSALYAGMSVGSHVFEHMVRAGIAGAHILADFDDVSVSNLNRIRVGMGQVGERKVDVFAKKASELDPYLSLTLLRDGVTEESLEGLVRIPDIIFDEVDNFAAKALLRMYAKRHKKPLIMATDVGYKTIIDVERHDLQETLPFNGRLSQATIEAMTKGELAPEEQMQVIKGLVGIGNISPRLLQSLSDRSLKGLPQLDVTASQGGALATILARDILLGHDVPSGRRIHDAQDTLELPVEKLTGDDGVLVVEKLPVSH